MNAICGLNFRLSTPGVAEVLAIGSWGNFLEDTIVSHEGSCSFTSPGILTISPATVNGRVVNSSSISCSFSIRPNTNINAIQLSGNYNPPIYLPTLVYFDVPFDFLPAADSTHCSNTGSIQPCYGQFIFPSAAFPITISTTSTISLSGAVSNVQLSPVSSEDLNTLTTIYKYRVDLVNEVNPVDIWIPVVLTKSIVSPYLKYYSRDNYVGESYSVVLSDVNIIPLDNCFARTSNLCTLAVELDQYTQSVETLTLAPSTYFKPTLSKLEICPGNPKLVSTQDIYLCQTFRKTIHTDANRAQIVDDIVDIVIQGASMYASSQLNIAKIIFIAPVSVEWDIDQCSDPQTPVCVAVISSIYDNGPAVDLSLQIPFKHTLDKILCNSDMMGVSVDKIYFPSRTGLEKDAVWVNIPEGLSKMECRVYFILAFDDPAGFGGGDVIMESYRENGVLSRFGLNGSVKVPDAKYLVFNDLPLQTYPSDDCTDPETPYCTVHIHSDPRLIVSESYLRNFEIYFPGVDPNYITDYQDYQVTLSGFSFTTLDVSTNIYPRGHELNPFDEDMAIFSLAFTHVSTGFDIYQSMTEPGIISIRYRLKRDFLSEPVLNSDNSIAAYGTVPYLLSYGNVLVGNQPKVDDIVPDHPAGFKAVFRSTNSIRLEDNCADPLSFFCTISNYRWQEIDRTYFTINYLDNATHKPTQVSLINFTTPLAYSYAAITDENGQAMIVGMVEWAQFKKNPEDPDEPLPLEIAFHLTKEFGFRNRLQLGVFTMNQDNTKATNSLYFTQNLNFDIDGVPQFDITKCQTSIEPNCYADYVFNNIISPNMIVISHEIPGPDQIHDVFVESCTNTQGNIPFTLILHRAGDADELGNIRDVDFITITGGDETIFPFDPSLPVTCRVVFRLENMYSRPRYRVLPFISFNQTSHEFTRPMSIWIPRMIWFPTELVSKEDCFQHQVVESTCTLSLSVFGTPESPIVSFSRSLPAAFPRHPIIPLGVSTLWLTPVKNTIVEAPGFDPGDNFSPATFSLDYVAGTTIREFRMAVKPGWQTRFFTAYLVLHRTIQAVNGDLTPIYAAPVTLPLNLNDSPTVVPVDFNISSMVSGPIVRLVTDKKRVSTPTQSHISMLFSLDVTTMSANTNFGNHNPIPCIEIPPSTARIPLSDDLSSKRYELFKLLQDIPDANEQITKLDQLIASGMVFDSGVPNPRILGWYERARRNSNTDNANTNSVGWEGEGYIPSNPNSTDSEETIPIDSDAHTNFVVNRSVMDKDGHGMNGLACAFYINIDHNYPTQTNQVRHVITVGQKELLNTNLFMYQDYTFFMPDAKLVALTPAKK